MNFNRVLGVRIEHNIEKKKELGDDNYTMPDSELKEIIKQQYEESQELFKADPDA